MEKEEATKLREAAQEIRKDVIQMTYNVGGIGAHIGGSLSLCEIMAVLYLKILHFDPQAPRPRRPRPFHYQQRTRRHGAVRRFQTAGNDYAGRTL